MASAKSNYLRELVLNAIGHSVAFPLVDPKYVLFYTSDLDTEVPGTTWTNYARVSIATTNGSSGFTNPADTGDAEFIDNVAPIDFGTAVASGTVRCKGAGLADAASGGNVYYKGWLRTNVHAFVGLAADDKLYAPGHGFSNGNLLLVSGSALPGGLTDGQEIYVINATTDDFQVSLTEGGAAIDLTTNGAGEIGVSAAIDVVNGAPVSFPIGLLDIVEA